MDGWMDGWLLVCLRASNADTKMNFFYTLRFPGGESYSDLINRLESVIIDMEQHLGPTVVVSHVSVLQVLISYFRSTPVMECTGIEIPMDTVLKFVPLRGGGWLESHHRLVPDIPEDRSESSSREPRKLVNVSNDSATQK